MNIVSKLSAEEKASIERLLASDTMTRAPRVRTVLKFLLDSLLEDRPDQISEQTIGRLVFGRPEGYNPADDNIVRVTIRHLRERLDKFYQTQGRDEPWIVEIPKGNYVPVIRRREVNLNLIEKASRVLSATPMRKRYLLRRFMWPVLVAFLLGSALLAYDFLGNALPLHAAARRPPFSDGLIQDLFAVSGQRVSVVLADSDLQAYRIIFRKTVLLDDYLKGTYLRPDDIANNTLLQRTWKYVKRSEDTTTSSALVATRLQASISPQILNIRYPRDLSMPDFQHDNVILLGGPWINPWGQLFEGRLNFRIITPSSNPAASEILNEKPLPGEPRIFAPHTQDGFAVSHLRIALLSNLTNTGKVVLVGANSDESLEAAGAFLVRQDRLREILRCFHVRSASDLPPLELVLEVRGIEPTPQTIRVIAYRTVASS